MQNLREAIAGYRGRLMHEGNDIKRNALLQVMYLFKFTDTSFCVPLLCQFESLVTLCIHKQHIQF